MNPQAHADAFPDPYDGCKRLNLHIKNPGAAFFRFARVFEICTGKESKGLALCAAQSHIVAVR
jgi:hypothetical protein